MKHVLLLLQSGLFLLFGVLTSQAQIQIGEDINGEAEGDLSGVAVSLSGDGTLLAIGARNNDGNGSNSGHVRIYENQSEVWVQVGQDIDGEISGIYSGISVSLAADGNIVAIGTPFNDDNGDDSGHVRIYENQSGVWVQVGSDIDGEAEHDQSGTSISLSTYGNIVAIGAPFNEDDSLNPPGAGHVRIYQNQSSVWTQVGSDIDSEAPVDNAGRSVSLSADGNIVAIGAPYNDGNGENSGHVRIYKNLLGEWTQVGEDIDGEAEDDISGFSVSLSANGNVVAIGAPFNDDNGNKSGQVRIFENQFDEWVQIGSDIDGEATDDWFGDPVCLSSNGNIVAIGAIQNDGNGFNSGHVRIYQKQSGVWVQVGEDIDGEAALDGSGASISLSSNGSIVAIGAEDNDGNGSNSGHVRVYDISAVLSTEEFESPSFSFYPNPTKNQFTIKLDNTTVLENVEIYDNLGKLMLSTKEISIDSSKLAAGLYIVEIQTNKGKGSKKLIIE